MTIVPPALPGNTRSPLLPMEPQIHAPATCKGGHEIESGRTRGQRYRETRSLNVPERAASAAVFCPKRPWRLSFSEALHRCFTKARFRRLGLPHTPQAHCVRFGCAVTGRTRNTRYRAARYALPERDLPPQDRADFAQRTAASSGIGTLIRPVGRNPEITRVRLAEFEDEEDGARHRRGAKRFDGQRQRIDA